MAKKGKSNKKTESSKKNNSSTYTVNLDKYLWSRPSYTELFRPTKRKPVDYFEKVIIRSNEVFSFRYRLKNDMSVYSIPTDKKGNRLPLNKHRVEIKNYQPTSLTVSVSENKKRALSKLWAKLIQFDPVLMNIVKFSKLTFGKFNFFKTIQHTYDRIRFANYYLHPIVLSKHSGAIVFFNELYGKLSNKISGSYKYFNIPVLCKVNCSNISKLP